MKNRRGFTIFEAIIALAILAVLLSVGFSAWVQSRQVIRFNDQASAAREMVILALERVRSLPPEALPQPGQPIDFDILPQMKDRLPAGRCDVSVAEVSEPLFKIVRVSVTWKGARHPESGEALVRLSAGAKP